MEKNKVILVETYRLKSKLIYMKRYETQLDNKMIVVFSDN